MRAGEQQPGRAGAGAAGTAPPSSQPRAGGPGQARPAVRRAWAAAALIAGALALVALVTRISMTSEVNSDGAAIALQGWDVLHGHLLMQGWITADASYYTFEVPQLAVAEFLFGLTSLACHVVSALSYVIVAVLAVALAIADSRGAAAAGRGAAAAGRGAVVLAVMAAPLLTAPGVATLLEAPQHIGTSAYLLGPFLLADRAPRWRLTAPLVGVILLAGQVGDATVLYVAVPAVVLVCAYRALAALRGVPGDRAPRRAWRAARPDAMIGVAAAASVPAAMLARVVLRHAGAYAMVPPRTAISPVGLFSNHAAAAWHDVRTLFGAAFASPGTALHVAAGALGWACLVAVIVGFARLVWTWRSARRAEQLAGAAIVVNLGVYVASTMAATAITSAREIAAVLPCGAVLAARACVPSRIAGTAWARAALGVAALAALLPLGVAAAQPTPTPGNVPLTAWLSDHGLSYGLAGYWNAASLTFESGDRVMVRAVAARHSGFAAYYWETKPEWYAASRHDATFIIADAAGAYPGDGFAVAHVERYFGRPAAAYRLGVYEILVYGTNLLERLAPPYVPSPTGKTE
jgi:hypothetical protein